MSYTPAQRRHPCRLTIASPYLKQLLQKRKKDNLYKVNLTDWCKNRGCPRFFMIQKIVRFHPSEGDVHSFVDSSKCIPNWL